MGAEPVLKACFLIRILNVKQSLVVMIKVKGSYNETVYLSW